MTILKKQGRCGNCGRTIPAGSEIAWKELTLNHRHGGNGTVTKTSTKWAPVHTSVLHCEMGVNSDQEVVAIYQDRVEKLARQAEKVADLGGDEEMVAVAWRQVRMAERDLELLNA